MPYWTPLPYGGPWKMAPYRCLKKHPPRSQNLQRSLSTKRKNPARGLRPFAFHAPPSTLESLSSSKPLARGPRKVFAQSAQLCVDCPLPQRLGHGGFAVAAAAPTRDVARLIHPAGVRRARHNKKAVWALARLCNPAQSRLQLGKFGVALFHFVALQV